MKRKNRTAAKPRRGRKNLVIIGAQWGDEGKAKMVDVLTEQVDLVARYQGGSNAGHTVVANGRKFVFHQIPSGILHSGKTCVIGNGVVLDPVALLGEVDSLRRAGVRVADRLVISDRAHLLMPYHRLLDGAAETHKGASKIGTTHRGIGPAYMDKMARVGLRLVDLFDPASFRAKVRTVAREKNFWLKRYFGQKTSDPEAVAAQYLKLAPRLKPLVADTSRYLLNRLGAGKTLLAEGAQGTLLDVDFGTYPYVTSSSASVGGACTGLGIGPQWIDEIYGVAKAYTTRVGEGPFPSEMDPAFAEQIRQRGGEYGATTGRPRRCGWLDLVALRYACRVNGFTGILLTKVDVLSYLKSLKLCVAYRYKGKLLDSFPAGLDQLAECKPVYKEMKGWDGDLSKAASMKDLPREARVYLAEIEKAIQTPITWVSVGQDRKQNFQK
ncbi:MAG TPA: adenylosuccinate synthase [bacterium]|nr:adenylosuccinate synthase [bacterium]